MASVAIIGGGISGLTAAYFLKKAGISFTLFEASPHLGGKIRSERLGGFLVEHGPNSLQTATPLINQLIDETGLQKHQIFAAPEAQKRFVIRKGKPVPLPMSPPALLASNYFSIKSKLALLREPFVSAGDEESEETVAQFILRRLGREFLDYAVDPFVSGIFAGDPEQLSLQHAFPALLEFEQKHGSLLKGVFKNQKDKKNGQQNGKDQPTVRRIFSFTEGMQMLPEAISRQFEDAIELETKIVEVRPSNGYWHLTANTPKGDVFHAFEVVLSTIPLPAFLPLTAKLDTDTGIIQQVPYPPVSVVALGFHRDVISHPLDGFGMLAPGKESSVRILGTIFSSTVFPNRAPQNHVLLTTLFGGARKGDFCSLEPELMQEIILEDLHHLLGVHSNPVFVKRIDWPQAIPQYNLQYGAVKAKLDTLEERFPGLKFAGNYRRGISVGDAVKSGFEAAEGIIRFVSQSQA